MGTDVNAYLVPGCTGSLQHTSAVVRGERWCRCWPAGVVEPDRDADDARALHQNED